MNERRKIPWYRRWWALTGLFLGILAAILFGWKVYREKQADEVLAAELALMQANDPVWQIEQWDKRRPVLTDEQNLNLVVKELKARLNDMGDLQVNLSNSVDMSDYPSHQLNTVQVKALQSLTKDCENLGSELDQILQRSVGYFAIPDIRNESFRVLGMSPRMEQQQVHGTVQMLMYQLDSALQNKNNELAAKIIQTILRLAHCNDYELGMISVFTSMSVQTRAMQAVERLMGMGEPTSDQLKQLNDALQREIDHSYFQQAFVYQRAMLDRYLREVANSRYTAHELRRMFGAPSRGQSFFSWRDLIAKLKEWTGLAPTGYIPQERAYVLQFFRQLNQRMQQPGPAPTLDEMRSLVQGYQGDSFTIDNSCKALRNTYEEELKRKVKLQMALALVAGERYRLATGKVPTGWSDLVPAYLPAVPIDLYDNQPLRWRSTTTGFIVYSIWTNQADDGGAIRQVALGQPFDVGVEYFEPAHRRKTPLKVVDYQSEQKNDILRDTFFAAARAGHLNQMQEVLDKGLDVNTKTDYGATALCYAAENGHLDVMKLLIDRKIDIHAKDTFYSADAITWAQMKDQDAAVAMLLKAGAKGEGSILAAAIFSNKPKMVAAALASGRIKQETLDSSLEKIDPKKTEIIKLLADAGGKAKPQEAKAETTKSDGVAKSAPKTDDTPQPTAPAVELTTKAEAPAPWPGFRGMNNSGVVDGQYPPTAWDATTGKNLAWKTPIPGLGLSCPVVWGNRLFITTAVNEAGSKPSLRIGQYGDVDSVKEESVHTWKVYCLDINDGKVLWERVAYTGIPKTKRHMKSSHANATPATDGKVVVVNFGSEGLYCYSRDGDQLWRKDLGKLGSSWFFNPDYEWGFGSSPVIFRDTVIVQCDIGKNSFIAAYSLLDGEVYWSTPRDEIPSWCSPTLVVPETGQPELVTLGSKYARSYVPNTGVELWKIGKFSEIAVPTPFYASGLIYLTTGYRPIQPIYAIKPGARGDLSLPKDKESSDYVTWSKQRGGPYLPTPLVYGDHLYVCSNAGVLSCYEAKTGKTVYQKRLGGQNGYTASLVAADGRLYCTDEEGLVRVVKTGSEFQMLALNKLGEECLSHPAISFGRIFYRCRDHVMAFEAGKGK